MAAVKCRVIATGISGVLIDSTREDETGRLVHTVEFTKPKSTAVFTPEEIEVLTVNGVPVGPAQDFLFYPHK